MKRFGLLKHVPICCADFWSKDRSCVIPIDMYMMLSVSLSLPHDIIDNLWVFIDASLCVVDNDVQRQIYILSPESEKRTRS